VLPRRYRLAHRADFARLRRDGRRLAHPLAVLIVCRQDPPTDEGHSRFAFVASKRVGKAVVRNRAKRLLRTAVALHLPHIPPGWDCLFIAREATPQATAAEVNTAVVQLLRRAHLL
jgi:ribonuclease P protein component